MFTRERLLPPSGKYRRAFTADELRLAGADGADAERSAGVTSLAFSGPHWNLRFAIEWDDAQRPPCGGHVELRGRFVELRWNPATPCIGYVGVSWRLDARGDLVFVTFDRRSEPPWTASAYRGPWKRVDCVTEAGILFTPGAYAYEKGKLRRLRLKLRELAENVREARGAGVRRSTARPAPRGPSCRASGARLLCSRSASVWHACSRGPSGRVSMPQATTAHAPADRLDTPVGGSSATNPCPFARPASRRRAGPRSSRPGRRARRALILARPRLLARRPRR